MHGSSDLRTSTHTSAARLDAEADHRRHRLLLVRRAFLQTCLALAVLFCISWARPVVGDNPEVSVPRPPEIPRFSPAVPEALPVPRATVPRDLEPHPWAPRRRFGPVSQARMEAWRRSLHPEPAAARLYGGLPFYYPPAFGRAFYRGGYGWPYRAPRGFGTRLPAYHGIYPFPW